MRGIEIVPFEREHAGPRRRALLQARHAAHRAAEPTLPAIDDPQAQVERDLDGATRAARSLSPATRWSGISSASGATTRSDRSTWVDLAGHAVARPGGGARPVHASLPTAGSPRARPGTSRLRAGAARAARALVSALGFGDLRGARRPARRRRWITRAGRVRRPPRHPCRPRGERCARPPAVRAPVRLRRASVACPIPDPRGIRRRLAGHLGRRSLHPLRRRARRPRRGPDPALPPPLGRPPRAGGQHRPGERRDGSETCAARASGVALTAHVLRWAHEQGIATMTTDWRMTNVVASRFWPKRGFRETFQRRVPLDPLTPGRPAARRPKPAPPPAVAASGPSSVPAPRIDRASGARASRPTP